MGDFMGQELFQNGTWIVNKDVNQEYLVTTYYLTYRVENSNTKKLADVMQIKLNRVHYQNKVTGSYNIADIQVGVIEPSLLKALKEKLLSLVTDYHVSSNIIESCVDNLEKTILDSLIRYHEDKATMNDIIKLYSLAYELLGHNQFFFF